MTTLEFAEDGLFRTELNLKYALERKSAAPEEITHLQEKLKHWTTICQVLKESEKE